MHRPASNSVSLYVFDPAAAVSNKCGNTPRAWNILRCAESTGGVALIFPEVGPDLFSSASLESCSKDGSWMVVVFVGKLQCQLVVFDATCAGRATCDRSPRGSTSTRAACQCACHAKCVTLRVIEPMSAVSMLDLMPILRSLDCRQRMGRRISLTDKKSSVSPHPPSYPSLPRAPPRVFIRNIKGSGGLDARRDLPLALPLVAHHVHTEGRRQCAVHVHHPER